MTEPEIDIDTINFMYHSLEFGVVTVPDVINWCDRIIQKSDVPDERLIELSMSPKNVHDVLKHLTSLGAEEHPSEDLFLSIIAGGYFEGWMDLSKSRSHLFQYFCIDWNEMTDIRQEVYLIDDEEDWDKARAESRLQRLLKPYKANYDRFRDKTKGLA